MIDFLFVYIQSKKELKRGIIHVRKRNFMEYNIVTKIDYHTKKEHRQLFEKILEKIVNELDIKKQYVFSLIIVDDQQIQKINLDYRNIDKPTDVISFALLDSDFLSNEEDELGDIFINADAIVRQSMEYEHSYERELCFLFTHGVLHLLGYDHMDEEQERVMFTLQEKILDGIIQR